MKRMMMLMALAVIATLAFVSVAMAGGAALPSNHYQCYKVKGEFAKVTVELLDQFSELPRNAVAIKPVLLCTPTDKVHGVDTFPITDPSQNYVCYSIKTDRFDKREVSVDNQFTDGSVPVTVIKPKMLCLPTVLGSAG
jgi:hypothetical protein